MERPEWEELKERLEFSEHKRASLQNRLSKGSIEEDTTLWSFVDLMTLLLILFILFYSHAVSHKSSAEKMAATQPQSSVAHSFQVQKTSIATEAVAYNPSQPKRKVFKTEDENQEASLEQLEQQVLQTVSGKVKNDFSIRWNQKRLVLVLGERIAFNVGEANLLPGFQPTLKRIAEFISSQKEYKIEVAGHTDDVPINTTQFPSNWELSAIRAVNVAKFMISNGVHPHRVSIQGYAAYRPLQPNTTSRNRYANRRVEITLIKEHENGKAAEEKTLGSAPDKTSIPQKATHLPTYPQDKHHGTPGYPPVF